jgi:toxin ParE1/3/4
VPANELRLLPEAQSDVASGELYYRSRSTEAADGFLLALDHAFALIQEAPERWPRHRRGTRRLVLQTYPYSVVYRLAGGVVWVIAVAHGKRHPEYWRNRRT